MARGASARSGSGSRQETTGSPTETASGQLGGDRPAGITVSGHHSPLAWLLVFTKLTVEIDGEPHVGSWRKRFIPTTPGDHQVSVYFRYVGQPRCAEASAAVTVPEHGVAALAFRAPLLVTSAGTLVVRPPD